MVVSTAEYLIPTYILGEAVRMPRWDGGRRVANTRNPVNHVAPYPGSSSIFMVSYGELHIE